MHARYRSPSRISARPTAAFARARVAASALAAALATALGGCAAGPDYRPPAIDTAPQYLAPAPTFTAAPPDERWWTAYGDPLLDDLIAAALADSPDLLAAEARVRAARALHGVVGAAALPQLEARGDVSRDRLSSNGENFANLPFKNPQTEFTDYRVGFDASWELDFAGRARRAREAAAARVDSALESRNEARVVLAAEVVSGYVSYRVGQQRVALAGETLAAYAQTAQLVDLQRAAGLASDLEQLRASAERRSAEAVIPPLEAETASALYRLAALVGQQPAALVARLAAAAPVPAPPDSIPVGLPSDLLQRRPDVRRAERELAAATADVGVAVAEQYPRFSLTGDAGLDSIRSGDLTGAASRFWNFGPQLTVPLLAGGRLRAQVSAREAARDAALQSYRAAVLGALADTESALIRYAGEHSRTTSLTASRAALDRTLALARQRYGVGETALIDVLDVQRQRNQLADQQLQSAGQAALGFAALHKALGGGWSGDSR